MGNRSDMKRKKAWLISWEILQRGGAADMTDGQVVAFLDHRLGDESVRQIMKALWIACGRRTWNERLVFATGKLQPSFFCRDLRGHIRVGYKPVLFGRIVENLEVTDEEDGGQVTWTEVIYGRLDAVTGQHTVRREKMNQKGLPQAI